MSTVSFRTEDLLAQLVVRSFGSSSSTESVPQQSKRETGSACLGDNSAEFNQICSAVRSSHSVIVLGEAGTGMSDFTQSVYEELLGDFKTAIAIYKGSAKKFFQTIAFELDIPTCSDLQTRTPRLANKRFFGSNYLQIRPLSNSHYLQISSNYLQTACKQEFRLRLFANKL